MPNQQIITLEMVRHPGAAAILPILLDGRILLLRQFRWAAGGAIYEVPAGKLEEIMAILKTY